MKLELKHLAPYLPYGVNMYYESEAGDWIESWELNIDKVRYALEFNNKPILRPLSDLSKGEFCSIIPQSIKLEIIKLNTCHWVSYHNIKYLLEHHFDVFGLIPQGLAIDINTIK